MLKYLLAVFFLFAFAFSTPAADNAVAFQGQGCMGTCTDCHSINKEEAGKLLKTDKFKAAIKDIRMSPVKGLWEVEFTLEGRPGSGTVYVDFAKKFLIQGASFTPLEKLGEEPPAKKIDVSKIPLDKALVFGDAKAAKKIIVFSDPDCPYCKKLHEEVKKIIKDRKDVAFYVKMFPLETHPAAYDKSKSIVCRNSQKLLEDAFAGKKIPKPKASCKNDEVDGNLKLGRELGLHGTPAIILPDGRMIPGYVPAEELLRQLDNPPPDAPSAKPEAKSPEKPEAPGVVRPDAPADAKPQTPSSGK